MKFGVFDQNDRSGRPLAQQYEERVQLVELYDRLGFHCYHMSEHHATSLSTTPSQNVLASALIQRTQRLRFCPLVYLLPIHHPMRLAEEICMLDHMSRGRFEFGIGKGASPHELAALGVDAADAQPRYAEAYEIIQRYFASDALNFEGRFWQFDNVPVEMKPLQTPHPPVWYALASPDSTVWPAQQGMNIVCGGPVARVGEITARFRAERAKAHGNVAGEPLIAVSRYIIVGESDEAALEVGRSAWPVFYANFFKLWRKHGTEPVNAKLPPTFDELLATGQAVAGSAETVRAGLAKQIEDGRINYLIGSFVFGSMPHADAVSSVERFAAHVMPALREANAMAA
ncbi:flavin-dependent oxidoreductase [Bosea caraganae]|uniref:Flavin-dependent oxidoreductase n=1 Tax=Bosea caraganae TaxID=2763117 RepID=A0A370KZL6_9HYPH|nr:LLM class flavin-dependent oxidoreductase [Bosea caraganae]RDJ20306.1 flavin-dependent oxidoreductase [Bosea caraganae]RDJ24002.1 flavin-dependent oxidoreductase [Bosea caraganae]